jgi:hypothetical protein
MGIGVSLSAMDARPAGLVQSKGYRRSARVTHVVVT